MELTINIPPKLESNWKQITGKVQNSTGHELDAETILEALVAWQVRSKRTDKVQSILNKVKQKGKALKSLPEEGQLAQLDKSMDTLKKYGNEDK